MGVFVHLFGGFRSECFYFLQLLSTDPQQSLLPSFFSPSCSLTLNSGQKASVAQHLFRLLSVFPACRGSGSLSLCVAPLWLPPLSDAPGCSLLRARASKLSGPKCNQALFRVIKKENCQEELKYEIYMLGKLQSGKGRPLRGVAPL